MFKCRDCESIFDMAKTIYEDCTPGGVFEGGNFLQSYEVCPYCESDDFFFIRYKESIEKEHKK